MSALVRSLLVAMSGLVLVACVEAVTPTERPIEERAMSTPTRWSAARRPSDAALLEAPAEVTTAAGGEASVSAPYTARVVAIRVRPGDTVHAGDPLIDVSVPEVLAAAATLSGARSRLAMRERRRTELEALRGEGLVESSRVFEQEAGVADLSAEAARALAVLRGAGLSSSEARAVLARGSFALRAPSDGVVRAVSARLGEVREPASGALVELSGLVPARVEAHFARPLPGEISLEFVPWVGEPLALSPTPVAALVDATTGSRVVWLAPLDEVALPPGLRGRVRVHVMREGALEVSARAVRVERGVAYVLRRVGDGHERVEVSVLASSAQSAIVESLPSVARALAEGDEVAVDAALLLGAPSEGDE